MLHQNYNFIEERLLVREALYPRSVVIQCSLNEELLREGLDKEMIKSIVQYIAGASAEYGLGGITTPAGGAGLAIGPATETAVDSLFAAESVASTVSAVANIGSQMGEFTDLFEEAYDTFSNMAGSLSALYQKLKIIIQTALKTIGEKVGGKVDGLAKKLKNILTKV